MQVLIPVDSAADHIMKVRCSSVVNDWTMTKSL